MTLEDSTTYQLILNRGEARAARNILLLQGLRLFGTAPPEVEAAIQAIEDRERLSCMAERILAARRWEDLLTTA